MLLIAIAHRMDQTTGSGRVTYDDLQAATGLSRTLISGGLQMLTDAELVDRVSKSVISLAAFEPNANYAKLPVKKLYDGEEVVAFRDFTLRNRAELDALKLYLLFASRRDRSANVANLSYDKIETYAGLDRTRIKRAIDLLVVRNLVRVDQRPSRVSELGMSHGYRLTGLDDYVHAGTRGRSEDGAFLDQDFALADTVF
ncbi:hypothetical protein ASE02_04405 [Phenylobacterium sp. Root700]|nr:hypothetical protein ASE02_04405 [Phenylobacterium sp. Root700]